VVDVSLGQRVLFGGTLTRCRDKTWQRRSTRLRSGVVVGLRDLPDGQDAASTVPAVLVAYDLRRRAVHVHPDDLVVAGG